MLSAVQLLAGSAAKVASLRRPIALASLAAFTLQVTVEKARADSILHFGWQWATVPTGLLALAVPADPADAVRMQLTGPGKGGKR